jgi:hypothetical protein
MSFFHEDQRIRQPWFLGILAVLIGLCWLAFVQPIIRDDPFEPLDEDPAPDWLVVALWIFLGLVLPLYFWWFRLETDVNAERLQVRMPPLVRREFRATDIAGFETRTYRPIREYGGWGIRGWGSNRAYNISGNQGLQLVLKDGRRVLIGTQRPDELESAVRQMMSGGSQPWVPPKAT